jgi:site-specific DNA-methyltransferase (adenine-specific)
MKDIPDKSIDSIITDPPYGINLQPQRGITKPILNDMRDDAKNLWSELIPECFRVSKNDTAHMFFCGWSEMWAVDILNKLFTVKACIVWVKNVFGIGYYTRPQHEFILYCHKGNPEKPKVAPSNVWDYRREHRPIHSCQKPVGLIERMINFTTIKESNILDPFMGSGTTGVACKKLNRDFIGIELDADYFKIASERIAKPVEVPLF